MNHRRLSTVHAQSSTYARRVKPSDLSRVNHAKNPTINVYIRFSHTFSRFPLSCAHLIWWCLPFLPLASKWNTKQTKPNLTPPNKATICIAHPKIKNARYFFQENTWDYLILNIKTIGFIIVCQWDWLVGSFSFIRGKSGDIVTQCIAHYWWLNGILNWWRRQLW